MRLRNELYEGGVHARAGCERVVLTDRGVSRRSARWMTGILAFGMMLVFASSAAAVTKEEVITLTKLGIAPSEIIKAIEKDKTVFNLAVTDILELKKSGVAEPVIKFMLGTPQRFGGGGGGGATGTGTGDGGTGASGGTGVAPPPPAPVIEETPEERAAREERMRQEALKLIEEKKKAEDAQRRAFAKGVLAKGRALADAGRFVESIQAFQEFMTQGGFAPDSEEAYLAKFGIANALVKAGLHQAAARQLVEVLLAGPERPFFQTAFEQLRALRGKVNYSPPDLEQLTRFFVGSYSQVFQDEYNYVLGEFYYDYNNWSRAVEYLDQVSANAPDYAKAQYLKGLVEVRNQLYRSAVRSFQNAIVATDDNKSDPQVAEMGYMALARIAYDSGEHDAAIYYYRRIPEESYKRAAAFYESSWVYFVKGDYSRALGTFQTLHSPYFAHMFYPELWILEATIYMNMCRFDDAELALDRYRADIAPIAPPLKEFLLKTTRPEQYWQALVETVGGKSVHNLPPDVIPEVLSDVEFYNLYRTIKQIKREIGTIEKVMGQLGPYGENMKRDLVNIRNNREREIGIKVQRVLKELEATLADYDLKVKEIEVDLLSEKEDEEMRKLTELEGGAKPRKTKAAAQGGASAIVGSSQLRWPYEGEFWSDEIGTYRAFVRDQCVREIEDEAPAGGAGTGAGLP